MEFKLSSWCKRDALPRERAINIELPQSTTKTAAQQCTHAAHSSVDDHNNTSFVRHARELQFASTALTCEHQLGEQRNRHGSLLLETASQPGSLCRLDKSPQQQQ